MRTHNQQGISLIIAVLIVGIVTYISVAVSNVAFTELRLTGLAERSQYAFYAANSGIECAFYWDLQEDAFPTPDAGDESNDDDTGSITCNNNTTVQNVQEGFSCDANNDGTDNTCDRATIRVSDLIDTTGSASSNACVTVTVTEEKQDDGSIFTAYRARGRNSCGGGSRAVERTIRTSF